MTKKNKNIPAKHGEIIIYTTDDKEAMLDVKLEQETVWLTQKQIADLFKTERSVITKHVNNVFKNRELEEDSVCAIFAHMPPMVAIALLIAESKPKEKEIMIALITNLLNEY